MGLDTKTFANSQPQTYIDIYSGVVVEEGCVVERKTFVRLFGYQPERRLIFKKMFINFGRDKVTESLISRFEKKRNIGCWLFIGPGVIFATYVADWYILISSSIWLFSTSANQLK